MSKIAAGRFGARTAMAAAIAMVGLVAPSLWFAGTASGSQGEKSPGASAEKDLATTTEPVGTVSHQGRWMTDADGRVVLFHGVNMVEKTAPYYPSSFGFGATDATWLESNGLDVVRLGVLATGLMPRPGHISSSYLDHLQKTVATLGRHHIYVLLDMHQDGFGPEVGSDGFPAWMTITKGAKNNHAQFPEYYLSDKATQQAFQSLWNNAKGPNGVGLQTDVASMFGALAKTFATTPNVVGYDAYNEPWPGNTWMPCLSDPSGCPSLDTSELDPLYKRIDTAIRAHDHRHLLFVEPFVLFNYGLAPTTVAIPNHDKDAGLAFHQYALTTKDDAAVLTKAITWSSGSHGALLDTEWGASMTGAAITTQANQFDAALLPWIFWSFDGEMVKNIGDPPMGVNLETSTVDAVVRPYLFVVGGTPTVLTYTATSHAFSASWSTTEPNGSHAAAGTVSTLELPKLVYPAGYTVTVTGGTVTSAACSPILTVDSNRAVSSITLHVVAGGTCHS